MTDDCSLIAKRVTHFMAGLNLGVGLVNVVMGICVVNPLQIAGGIIYLIGGTILLIGLIKDCAKFLLVYFIIESVMFALGTISGLLFMIVLVTASFPIRDEQSDVKIGVDKYMAAVIAFVVLVAIIISWVVHFLVYVFYDDVVVRKRGAVSQGVENTTVRYDVMGENSDGTNEGCRVKFVDNRGNGGLPQDV